MPLMYPTSLNLNAACLKQLGTRANIWKSIFMCVEQTRFDPLLLVSLHTFSATVPELNVSAYRCQTHVTRSQTEIVWTNARMPMFSVDSVYPS